MIQKIQSSYKAFAVFIVGFAGFVATTSADKDIAGALPQGVGQWLTLVGVPALLAFSAWVVRNKPTVDEAAEILRRAESRAVGERSL